MDARLQPGKAALLCLPAGLGSRGEKPVAPLRHPGDKSSGAIAMQSGARWKAVHMQGELNTEAGMRIHSLSHQDGKRPLSSFPCKVSK